MSDAWQRQFGKYESYLKQWLATPRTEHEFDRHFLSGGETPVWIEPYDKDFIIPPIFNGDPEQQTWLMVLQHMIANGLVDAKRERSRITYSLLP